LQLVKSEGVYLSGERPLRAGELCTWGRSARMMFVNEGWGEVGWGGISDRGARGPRSVCQSPSGHDAQRWPEYLRLDSRAPGEWEARQ
jgi:hypothetical protein